MANEMHWLNPISPVTVEILAAQQVTREFYHEVRYREEFEYHCQWYYTLAAQHQQELAKMRHDLNILGWFVRRRPSAR